MFSFAFCNYKKLQLVQIHIALRTYEFRILSFMMHSMLSMQRNIHNCFFFKSRLLRQWWFYCQQIKQYCPVYYCSITADSLMIMLLMFHWLYVSEHLHSANTQITRTCTKHIWGVVQRHVCIEFSTLRNLQTCIFHKIMRSS